MLCDWLFYLMRPTIMKFGGTSVEDADAFRKVVAIVKSHLAERPVIVVSAVAGFTSALLASAAKAIEGDARAATKSLHHYFGRHSSIAEVLLSDGPRQTFETAAADARRQIRQLHKIIAAHPVTSPPLQDEIVAYGEYLSSLLLAAVLRENGLAARHVDGRECIRTDDNYGNAAPLSETAPATQANLSPLIEAEMIPVVGGFIGSTKEGATTTLGGGGSDYAEALLGAGLGRGEIPMSAEHSGGL